MSILFLFRSIGFIIRLVSDLNQILSRRLPSIVVIRLVSDPIQMVSIVGGYSAFDHFRTENTFRYGNDDQFHRRMNHLIDFHTSTTIHAHIFILFLMDTQSLARSYTFYWILFSFLWNLLYFFLLFVIIFLVKNNCKSHLFSIKLD